MFKMFHYMKERWYYIVMIVALLFVQAFCDLSLPDYTSKIINVGIQQKGVEDGVPETIREESMDKLLLFLEQEEAEEVLDAYKNKDGIYELQSVTEEEREENNIEEFSTWKTLRPFCFSLIKGKKLPGSFRIVLQLPKAGTDKFAARTGAGIDGNQIVGLYLNIRYDNGEMYCITGTSLNFFTMDKTLDLEWDKAVKQFLQSHEIPCTEATEG